MTTPAEAALVKLANFGAWCAIETLYDLADIDGGAAQDAMARFGVLVRTTVTEPCGEDCRCAEYDDFPLDCYRTDPDVQRAIDNLTTEENHASS